MQPILKASNLCKIYGSKTVVDNLSIDLFPSQITGLLGPNGAGKSTTVSMLYYGVKPSSGSVIVNGYNVASQSKIAKSFIGVVNQDERTDPDLNVYENIYHFAYYYGITGKKARIKTESLIEELDLTEYKNNLIDELSGGYKRRVMLARALINDPKVIFLDEPTTGLDPHIRQDFWRLINNLKNESRAILLTTHYMDEAERLSDIILIIQKGKIIDHGTPSEIINKNLSSEVIEIEGITLDEMSLHPFFSSIQALPLGNGVVLIPDAQMLPKAWEEAHSLNSRKLTKRKPNLDDVFIKITGEYLGYNE